MPAANPESLADVLEHGVYRLAVAARLLDVTPVTFKKHARPEGLIRPTPTAWVRVKGSEILRQYGQREVERAGRTSERGETERERQKRVEADRERLLRILGK